MPVVVGRMSGGQDDAGQCSHRVEVGARTRGGNGAASVDVMRYLGSGDLGSDQDRVSFLVGPRCPELGERPAGRGSLGEPVVDVLDDRTNLFDRAQVLILALPVDGPGSIRMGSSALATASSTLMNAPVLASGTSNVRSVPTVGQQVLDQIGPAGDLGPQLTVGVHLDPIGGVEERGPALGALDVHLGIPLDRRAQAEGARDLDPLGGADPNHRRVVAVDGVGPVEVGVNSLDVLERPAADDGQRRGHGMGQRVGDHPVNDRPAAQAPAAGPG